MPATATPPATTHRCGGGRMAAMGGTPSPAKRPRHSDDSASGGGSDSDSDGDLVRYGRPLRSASPRSRARSRIFRFRFIARWIANVPFFLLRLLAWFEMFNSVVAAAVTSGRSCACFGLSRAGPTRTGRRSVSRSLSGEFQTLRTPNLLAIVQTIGLIA